jgi:hypothetical protein
LSLGVVASLAVAQGGSDQPPNTQGTTDTQTTTASDTRTGTTETPSGSSGSRPGQAGGSGSRYIVVYRDSVSDPQQKTAQLERDAGFKSDFKYSRALRGFARGWPEASLTGCAKTPRFSLSRRIATFGR